jgi:hypothetical protein
MGGVSLSGLGELFLQFGVLPLQRVAFGDGGRDACDPAMLFHERERWQRVIAEFSLTPAVEVRLQFPRAAKFVK